MVDLPKQLRQHKDKIIYLGLAAGGLFAAALRFEFASVEVLKDGFLPWVLIGISVIGLWTFQEGFIKMRKRRRTPGGLPRQVAQVKEAPSTADLGIVQQPVTQQSSPYQTPPIEHQNQPKTADDIFKDFQ